MSTTHRFSLEALGLIEPKPEHKQSRSRYEQSPYARISGAIIRRINYPRARGTAQNWNEVKPAHLTRARSLNAKSRPLLPEHEQEEVHQTVALILLQRGVMPGDKLTLGEHGDWRAVFSGVRALLGIDKHARSRRSFIAHESLPDGAIRCEPVPAFVDDPAEIRDIYKAYRTRLARRYRYAHSQAYAAFLASTKRKRNLTYHNAIKTFRLHIRCAFRSIGQPLFEGVSDSTRRFRDYSLRNFLDEGEAALTADALLPKGEFEETGFRVPAFATL
jgi:hypothetical protein